MQKSRLRIGSSLTRLLATFHVENIRSTRQSDTTPHRPHPNLVLVKLGWSFEGEVVIVVEVAVVVVEICLAKTMLCETCASDPLVFPPYVRLVAE